MQEDSGVLTDVVLAPPTQQDTTDFNFGSSIQNINKPVVPIPQCRVNLTDFRLVSLLGTGAYGHVHLVQKLTDDDADTLYAMKSLSKKKIVRKANNTEHFKNERRILEIVADYPFLSTMKYAFESNDQIHFIFDFCQGGELFQHLTNTEHNRFDEETAKFYITELILAIEQLHNLGIMYRDIKLENILIDQHGHVVLSDFGLAKSLNIGDPLRSYTYCGTMEYMAPEVVELLDITPRRGYDQSVDWWSVGCVLYELVIGTTPFSVHDYKFESNKERESALKKRIIKAPLEFPCKLSEDLSNLLGLLLQKDPDKRLGSSGVNEIKKHPFFKDIDWRAAANKQLPVPIVPDVKNDKDLTYFAKEFTSREVKLRRVSELEPNMLAQAHQLFQRLSFVAPSFLALYQSHDELMGIACPDKYPSVPSLLHSMKKNSQFHKDYEICLTEPALGDGSYSVVRKCIERSTGHYYAVKIICDKVMAQYEREVYDQMGLFNHPCVVDYVTSYTDDENTYIVMELLHGGDLREKIRKKGIFTELEAKRLIHCIADGILHLHERGIIHRDIKPENLVFATEDENSSLKIVDFNFARTFPADDVQSPPFSFTSPNLERYGFVEGAYTRDCDLWSLGVVMYTMLVGHDPFVIERGESQTTLVHRIKYGHFNQQSPNYKSLSSEAKNLIRGLLKVDLNGRYNANKTILHRWLTSSKSPLPPERPVDPRRCKQIESRIWENQMKQTFNAFHLATRRGKLMGCSNNSRAISRRRQIKRHSSYSPSKFVSSSSSSGTSSMKPSRDPSGQASFTFPHGSPYCLSHILPVEKEDIIMFEAVSLHDDSENSYYAPTIPLDVDGNGNIYQSHILNQNEYRPKSLVSGLEVEHGSKEGDSCAENDETTIEYAVSDVRSIEYNEVTICMVPDDHSPIKQECLPCIEPPCEDVRRESTSGLRRDGTVLLSPPTSEEAYNILPPPVYEDITSEEEVPSKSIPEWYDENARHSFQNEEPKSYTGPMTRLRATYKRSRDESSPNEPPCKLSKIRYISSPRKCRDVTSKFLSLGLR